MNIDTMMLMEFSDWITKKYIAWRGDAIGQDRSITEFAKLIGVSQSLMSQWMKKGGKQPTSTKHINNLIDKYGDDAYGILGINPPAVTSLDHLPPIFRDPIQAALAEMNSIYATRGISPDSPEAVSIAVEVMDKHGFILKQTVKGS
jgi:hypothetical protein